MSLYRQGISANIGADDISEAQWVSENAVLQKAITERVKTFPNPFTEQQAAEVLEAAVVYGKKMLAKYAGFFNVLGVNTNAAQIAINVADDASKKWRGKIPWLAANAYKYTKGKNREWDEVYNQVMKIYVESAGLIGQRIVKDEAVRELAHNLNPVKPTNIVKILLIGGGVAAATVWLMKKNE